MTNEEKQEIIAAVLSAISTNSKTISQLTAVSQMQNDDYLELSGGRKVSYSVFIAGLATAAQLNAAGEYLDNKKTDKDASGLVECHQARVVYLDGMGSIDGGSAEIGDGRVVYNPSTKMIFDSDGGFGEPKPHAVYISKLNQLAYEWDGTDLVPMAESVKNRQVIDYINTVPAFEDMDLGTMYYMSSSHKLAVKISESQTTSFAPNPNMIYYARDAQKSYIWNASNNTWQQI